MVNLIPSWIWLDGEFIMLLSHDYIGLSPIWCSLIQGMTPERIVLINNLIME